MNGFAALTTVLIILVISLIIGLSIMMLSTNDLIMGLGKTFSSKAYYLANSCAEEGLMKLKENSGYLGNESFDKEGGNCKILPIEGNWTIKTIGTYANTVKKMKIVITTINPKTIIQSWNEVGDF